MNLDTRSEADRLVAAALAADAQGDASAFVDLLRRCLALDPLHVQAHYLLGADCAQDGRNGDAILHLSTAVEHAPGLAPARLQLGLLWLSTGNPRTAQQVLAPLAALPDDDVVGRFGVALSALAGNDIAAARAALHEALALPCDHPAMLADIRTVLARLEPVGEEESARNPGPGTGAVQAGADPDAERQALQLGLALSAYADRDPGAR